MDIPTQHQLRIARRTLFELSDVGAFILGGMNKAEARRILLEKGTANDRARISKLDAEKTLTEK